MRYQKYLDKLPSLEGKTIVITGANSGIGLEACFHLAYKKAHIIMACRNLNKANKAKEKILELYPNTLIDVYEYDQASFESITNFVCKLNKINHIDALVCNAGVYYPKANYKTKDNYELTLGTNYIGVFKLIDLLLPKLRLDHSRIVGLGSIAAIPINKKISLKESYKLSRNQIYGYSKYCITRFLKELSIKEKDISVKVVHPGITATNIISSDQTGLPKWYSRLGHRFLTIFTHHASKASLVILKGITSSLEEKPYIGPRGLFSISGYPKNKNFPKYSKKEIINETRDFLLESEN